jgi:signal transduction histidine kinase
MQRFDKRSSLFCGGQGPPLQLGMPDDSLTVRWNDVVRFVRQLSHDLRNQLNAIELQTTLVSELVQNEELKGEVKRLRGMISGLTTTLHDISSKLNVPTPDRMVYRAADFMEDLRKRVGQQFPQENLAIIWKIDLNDEGIEIDPQLLLEAFLELVRNAFQHGPAKGEIAASAKIETGRFLFTMIEPKERFELSTENWGREPLRYIGRGDYGLGLNRARRIVEAHDGKLQAQYEQERKALVTTIVLPLAK